MNKSRTEISLLDIPHPVQVSGGQLDMLLRTVATLTNTLAAQKMTSMDQSEHAVQGEARCAAEVAFMTACDALDTFLKDKSRFDQSFQKLLETRADEIHRENLAFIQAQKAAAEEVISPHFQHRPNLRKIENGGWCAFVGQDPTIDPENSIFGIGLTPEAAFRSFDDVFRGQLPVHMLRWLMERQAAQSQNQTPPQPPSNTPNAKTMVRRRNKKTRNTPKSGEDNSGNPS